MPLLLLVLLLPVIVIALMPVILLQRYRLGTTRRLARPWAANLTLGAMVFSAAFFLVTAALTTVWVAGVFRFAVYGLMVGSGLGVLGIWLTRWEPAARTLHYTPNRWLVLIVTLLVSARVVYGMWRSWAMVRAGVGGTAAVTGD